ncbi:MAG: HDOD domain-containing protein [Pseudomonadota bacterium]
MNNQSAAFAFVKTLGQELSHQEFDIPPFPDIAIKIRDAMSNPNVNIDMISRIIMADPVLTSRLIRMANSALLRRGTIEITDLKTAVGRIGLELVRNTVVSMAMDNTFKAPAGSILHERIDEVRRHSSHVAALAYILAKRQPGFENPDDAMLAGLLHDIGKFYILNRVQDFPALFDDPEQLEELVASWHTGVGRAIVESWGFPQHIAEAVDEHEALERNHFTSPDVADVVLVANLVENVKDLPEDAMPDFEDIPACKRMRMRHDTMRKILEEFAEEIASMEQALGGYNPRSSA